MQRFIGGIDRHWRVRMRHRLITLAYLALLLPAASVSADPAAQPNDRVTRLVTTVCQACHMSDGNSAVPLFPKLAGQHAEYLARELEDMLEGRRRNDTMGPILAQFKKEDVPGLAAYYASQSAAPGTVRDASLLESGRRIYEDGNEETGVPSCSGCHGDDGSGTKRFPRLAGQNQDYVVQELKRFRSGARTNVKYMKAVSERLTDAEITAVAEYLASLK